ncbi:MAG: sn-glycerol-3-phosphate ABC transporter ATP-binding protein UgpC [Erysipelotrichaceae bacterium]|nr:sn-glycerol-3-phosphate ABC transporter ATP-binding protein UgpC [Erysipelotrichaceae bacterium]
MSADVILKDVNKVYPNGFHAVYDFNIEIEKGEFIVLAGPSGCGKSTTLRMIAGLEEISSGDLIINGKRCNDVAPKDRDIAMVFQNYALYAHMTVYHNMAFSLTIRKVDPVEIHARVMKAADILGLIPYLNRKPKQLSGGQRQRVACGRAIVRDPVVFLLDEPLSNLDAKLRGTMRKELMQLHERLNATFVYVTHDQIEALTLASRIVVMKDGYVQQIATPKEMFDKPENLFVAGFIGTPPMNFANGSIDLNCEYFEHISGIKFKLTNHQKEILQNYAGKSVIMASRAEYIFIDDASLSKNKGSAFEIDVDYTEYLGAYNLIYGSIGDEKVIAKVYSRQTINADKIKACFDMEKIHFFDIETTKRIR